MFDDRTIEVSLVALQPLTIRVYDGKKVRTFIVRTVEAMTAKLTELAKQANVRTTPDLQKQGAPEFISKS